jgi:hypothetical protein
MKDSRQFVADSRALIKQADGGRTLMLFFFKKKKNFDRSFCWQKFLCFVAQSASNYAKKYSQQRKSPFFPKIG